ncbi:MAG: FKBP-type peptidyl-prolyl cis-trans isomerase [Bacteroidota bacterium]|nr:FKBP-type peptidyl-prolyl cis-trans isomerase [Bacteroidota bacterium]
MKKIFIYSLALLFVGTTAFAQKSKKAAKQQPVEVKTVEAPVFKTFEDSVSYAYGTLMGADMQKNGVNFDADILAKGMKEATSPNKLITEEKARELMTRFQQKMQAKMQAERDTVAKKNLAAGNKFLAENKAKPGIITTASGLQYEIVKKGDEKGALAKLTDEVTVNYEGKLLDGTVFDSSYKRGEPVTFPLNGVIPGWQEAVQLMRAGDTFNFYIPANLAYGEKGAGKEIAPNQVLIFKIELISAKDAPKPEAAPAPQAPTAPTKQAVKAKAPVKKAAATKK